MAEIKFPADMLHWREFAQVMGALKSGLCAGEDKDRLAADLAIGIVFRLFVELAYQARSHNQPGRLEPGTLSATDQTALCAAPFPLLREQEDGSIFCNLFAQLNPETAGNYISPARKGTLLSALARGEPRLRGEAAQMAFDLGRRNPHIFKDSAGRDLAADEIERVMVLIRTVDGIMKRASRPVEEFSAPVIVGAAAVVTRYSKPVVNEFNNWLVLNRDHPAIRGRTTEDILARFDELMALR